VSQTEQACGAAPRDDAVGSVLGLLVVTRALKPRASKRSNRDVNFLQNAYEIELRGALLIAVLSDCTSSADV